MNKKTWIEKRGGLLTLKKAAEHNQKVATEDIEDLVFLLSCYDKKIATFK